MKFGHSLFNLTLGAFGGLLGNLLASWILQDAWDNLFTPWRLAATVVGFGLVILLMAWLDARSQGAAPHSTASSRASSTRKGELRDNIQIGRSLLRVVQGTNAVRNIQIGDNTMEVLPSYAPPPVDSSSSGKKEGK